MPPTFSVHHVDVPLQAIEHVAQHVGRAAVAQAGKVLAQEEGLVLKAGVGEGLRWGGGGGRQVSGAGTSMKPKLQECW
jgi:hypothetical protein